MRTTGEKTTFIDQATIAIMAAMVSNPEEYGNSSSEFEVERRAEQAAKAAVLLWKARDEYYD